MRNLRERCCAVIVATGLGVGVLLALRAAAISAADPQTLLARAWENLYAGDYVEVLALTNRARSGRSMVRKLQILRKQSVAPGRALVRFLEPADIRGTSLLVLERDDRDDDIFVYLPVMGRARRLTSAQRSDAFFGTNLTYEDLEPKHASDFTSRFAQRSSAGGCTWLEVRPRPGVASQYDRILTCIEEARAVVLRTEYFVEGRLSKTLEGDPASVQAFDGRYLTCRARIVSTSSDFETQLEIESHDSKVGIPDALFSVVNLEAGSERGDRTRVGIGPPG